MIFNLAGQVSHIDSMQDPYTDLEINCRSQLSILEACRRNNPAVKVVFASTRQVYGRPDSLPVSESHLVRPTDVNGINKAAGEYYHLVYNNVFGVRACSLRLSNVFGPRQLLKHNRQGFIGWFIRLAIEDQEIQIYGDGAQLRDFVYVDDAADAFLRAGATDASQWPGLQRRRDASRCRTSRAGRAARSTLPARDAYRFVEWPPDKKAIDIGELHYRLLTDRATLGWRASTPLRAGFEQTIDVLSPAPGDHYVPLRAGHAVRSDRRICRSPISNPVTTTPTAVRAAIDRVIARGWFVLGPELEAFERSSPQPPARDHAVGVGNGTDAIALLLQASGISPGDEVLVPAMTAAFTALGVMATGARPVIVDVDAETLTHRRRRLRGESDDTRAAPSPCPPLRSGGRHGRAAAACRHHVPPVIEDCCQAHLAT